LLIHKPFVLPGPSGKLEAVISPPSGIDKKMVAIVCHPHPLYGGTMNNKVVTTLCSVINKVGGWALRFNYRGVGASEGSYADTIGETEDCLAVLDWVKHITADSLLPHGLPREPTGDGDSQGEPRAPLESPSRELVSRRRNTNRNKYSAPWGGDIYYQFWLAGFSFGAVIATQVAAKHSEIKQLITVAPPVNHFDLSIAVNVRCPWIVVQGGMDELVPAKEVIAWAQTLPASPELIVLEQADHFFHGQIIHLRQQLERALKKTVFTDRH